MAIEEDGVPIHTQDENSVPEMSGTQGGSGKALPCSIVPARGHVSENDIHPPNKHFCDVFHEQEAGS
jgi:hypothetical protein